MKRKKGAGIGSDSKKVLCTIKTKRERKEERKNLQT